MKTISLNELTAQLKSKSSTKRRSAAKKLRKLKCQQAGSLILSAIETEIQDTRTWETQYHMIMALSDSSYCDALAYLKKLSLKSHSSTMVDLAIGHAITNLEFIKFGEIKSLQEWMTSKKTMLLEGAFRALTMHRITPNNEVIKDSIKYAADSKNDGLIFWLTAATPKWPKKLTISFLTFYAKGALLNDIKKAAEAALNGKYLKWKPL